MLTEPTDRPAAEVKRRIGYPSCLNTTMAAVGVVVVVAARWRWRWR
jgi:hypothetical protein